MTTTLRQFIVSYGLSMTAEWADVNPHMDEMPIGSSHWRCVLRCGRRRLTTHFSMGPAHSSEPTIADVLDCLAADAAGVENARSFEDWCGDYGYDPDSRKAERIYTVIQKQAARLRRLLYTPEAYDALLFKTERE